MHRASGLVVWLLLLIPSALAEESVRLDAALRAEVATLGSLAGPALSAEHLAAGPVLVSFFASWCPPCRVEFEHLNELTHKFGGERIRIVAINVFENFFNDDQDQLRLRRFLADMKPRFHVVEGTESIKRAFGNVDRIPTLFVFDGDGKPVMHFIHKRGATKTNAAPDELHEAVAAALAR